MIRQLQSHVRDRCLRTKSDRATYSRLEFEGGGLAPASINLRLAVDTNSLLALQINAGIKEAAPHRGVS